MGRKCLRAALIWVVWRQRSGPFPEFWQLRKYWKSGRRRHGCEENTLPRLSARSGSHSLAAAARVIAAGFPQVGIGLVGVSLAFRLSVVTLAYAIGHISGCHLNPAVTVGLAAGGRFPDGQILPYIIAQVIGAIVAAWLLYVIASGAPGFDVAKGFASNGYDAHSPGQYSMVACFITEVVMTMMFLFIIMGSTRGRAPAGFAPLAIGLALVMIHLVGIPVTNTSVNPARSTGPALFVGGWALGRLWLFWVAPLDRRRAGRRDLSLARATSPPALSAGVEDGVIARSRDRSQVAVPSIVEDGLPVRGYCLRGGVTSVAWPILRPDRGVPLP